MAMVLDAFASYVQNMLTEMVTEEVHMLLGVGDEIEKMDVKLRDLKNFLADADRRNITDKTMQEWVAGLKRAMYEAADILDLCRLKAMEQGQSTVDVGCFNPLLFCMRNPAHAHNIGTRIKELNKKLSTIKERGDAFNFINLGSYDDRNSRVHASHAAIRSRETSGEYDRSGIVGKKIEEDSRAIIDIMLTEKEGNANIMVVAIVGVGGIGKTTLAKKVFNDEIINAEFDKTIWLSINQNFDKVELIKTMITLAGGECGGGAVLAVLQPILTTAVTGKKLFIVMDDAWSPRAWDDMLGSHLANVVARGSRILVTTRDERIARGMKAMFPYHHIDKLEEEDGWSLLKKQLIFDNYSTNPCSADASPASSFSKKMLIDDNPLEGSSGKRLSEDLQELRQQLQSTKKQTLAMMEKSRQASEREEIALQQAKEAIAAKDAAVAEAAEASSRENYMLQLMTDASLDMTGSFLDAAAEDQRVEARTTVLLRLAAQHGSNFWVTPERTREIVRFQDRAAQVRDFLDFCTKTLFLVYGTMFPRNKMPETLPALMEKFRDAPRIHGFVRAQLEAGARFAMIMIQICYPKLDLTQIIDKCLAKQAKRRRNVDKIDDAVRPVAEKMMDELLRLDAEFFVKGSYAEHSTGAANNEGINIDAILNTD